MSSLITSGRAVVAITRHYRILSASKTGRSGQLLSLVTAGAPEGGLSGGCQGVILSSRRLNVKKEIPIIFSLFAEVFFKISGQFGVAKVSSLRILPVHLVEESGAFKVIDEARLREDFWIRARDFRIRARQQIEHRFRHPPVGSRLGQKQLLVVAVDSV